MAGERWDFIVELPPVDRYNSSSEFASDVADFLLNNYNGEITPEVRISAEYFSYLCVMIVEDGYSVITKDEIQDAVHFSQNEWREREVLHQSAIVSWLLRAGFDKLNTKYCFSEHYDQFKHIYCAPISPTLEDILNEVNNQPVISVKTIEHILRNGFSQFEERYHVGYRDHVPDITEEDLQAYIGLIRSELDRSRWVRGEADQPRNEIWLNPEALGQTLESRGRTLSKHEFERVVIDIIVDCTPELQIEAKINLDDVVKNLGSSLKTRFGWNTIWTNSNDESHLTWYSPQSHFKHELKKLENQFKELFDTASHWEHLRSEELKARKLFLQHNRAQLKSVLGYQAEELDERIRQLSSQIEYKEQIAPLVEATPATATNDLQSIMEPPSSKGNHEKRSFWEFQRELEDSDENDSVG